MITMKKYLTSRETQLEEKKILDEVVKFLEKNNLRYFLIYGTLLGAIRHKGFIPWDDDIDIAMPRPDYDKLQRILKESNSILNDNLHFHSLELNNLNMPFTKVYNYSINIEDWRYNDKYEKYLWIDIFPIDGLPSDDKKVQKMFKKAVKWRKSLMYRKTVFKFLLSNRTFFKNILKIFSKIIFSIFPSEFASKMIININKCNYDECDFVGDFVWGNSLKEKMKKEIYEDYIDVEFEGKKYKGLKNYDKYLTQIYGDYMKLPPVEKRKTHSFKAWRVDNNEKEIKK